MRGMFLNTRSLTQTKFMEIRDKIKTLDFFAVCETWFHKNTPFHLYNVDGFDLFNNYRTKNKGGGTSIWIKESYHAKQLNYTIQAEGSNYEQIVIKCGQFILVAFYRPPSSSIDTVLSCWDVLMMRECSTNAIPVFIGDLNMNPQHDALYTQLLSRNLRNYQLCSTRYSNLLDVCISFDFDKHDGVMNDVSVSSHAVFELDVSDHLPIEVCLKCKPRMKNLKPQKTPHYVCYRNWKNFNPTTYTEQLTSMYWESYEEALQVDHLSEACKIFTSNLHGALNVVAPVEVRVSKYDNYLPAEIRRWMGERNRLLKLTYRYPNNEALRTDLKRIRNLVISLRREFDKKTVSKKIEKCERDSSRLWSLFKDLLGKKTKRSENEVSAKELNNFFASPKSWCDPSPRPLILNTGEEKLSLRLLSREDVIRAIKRLKTNKAAGLDGITNKMLKYSMIFIASKLLSLFNSMILKGEFMDEWKEAKIKAIYKNSGDPKMPDNYRPISLLSCISKLFERCVHPQIYDTLEPFLPNCQHAFRKKYSIETAVAEICEVILTNMDNDKLTYIVQLDVKKAYDSVNPFILLQNIINRVNPSDELIKLLQGYLLNRRVRTIGADGISESKECPMGLPQGGVLPPILFSFLFSSISEIDTNGKMIIFADDVQMLYECDVSSEANIERIVEVDMKKITDYLRGSVQMMINSSKTVISRYGRKQTIERSNITDIMINGERIEVRKGARNLGLYLDSSLTFKPHFDDVARSCTRLLYHMKAVKQYVDVKSMSVLVNAYVVPKIRLFLPITETASEKHLKVLQRVANHSIRVIHNLRKFDRLNAHRNLYCWGDIMRFKSMCFTIMAKKMEVGILSENLNGLLIKTSHNRTRRQMYTCQTFRTNHGHRTIKYRATNFLNDSN